ncbi:MAG: hypothetical protein GY821_16795 [Gammaproteobacteria bacterium]|nr:hypothetical protein [Gammaproteobacteria bacterium]
MGLLIEGKWHDQWYQTSETAGKFVREASQFRHTIGSDAFPAEAGRYQLIVSLACPWAHRTLIFRVLKKLQQAINITLVSPLMLEQGWQFDSQLSKDIPLANVNYLHQLYTHADANYSGRVTVPILWDKQRGTIVNNESAEIIRILNSAFNEISGDNSDYYPEALRTEIDNVNERIYDNINNGVYRVGFATTRHCQV